MPLGDLVFAVGNDVGRALIAASVTAQDGAPELGAATDGPLAKFTRAPGAQS